MPVVPAKSKVDWYLVSRVKQMRLDAGMSQEELAIHLGVSKGYLGHVESPKFSAKYNTNHLNMLAKIFKCSPKEFWPDKAL